MIEIRKTDVFERWLTGLRDKRAVARINARLRRMMLGNPGDVSPVREGISELRVDYGPGYRVYFVQHGREVVVILAGGDKRTQSRDIEKALEMARML
jgi:putative addiction module killer protein